MSMFRSIVCVKAVPDPESPSSAFEIDPVAKEMIPIGVPPVINPFDENALELALRLKDAVGGKVTAITVAEKSIATVNHKIKTASDDFYLLTDAVFKDLDSRSIACVLERAIRNAGDFDLIITGRQAADWGFGQVGPMLATMLDIPCISLAISARVEGRSIIVETLKRNGYETVKAQLPVLLTATSEIGDLRLFSLRDIKEARKKPETSWHFAELGISLEKMSRRKIENLTPPPSRKRQCFFAQGTDAEEKARSLTLKLRQDHVL